MQKMSEGIALYCLKADSESYSEVCEECSIYGNVGCDHCYNDAINMAIKALEELSLYKKGSLVLIPSDVFKRQCDELDVYKAIGTVEECREAVDVLRKLTGRNMTVEVLENYMQFEDECVKQGYSFKSILEARERMKPKKVKKIQIPNTSWSKACTRFECPSCNKYLNYMELSHCGLCGQALDWGEEHE